METKERGEEVPGEESEEVSTDQLSEGEETTEESKEAEETEDRGVFRRRRGNRRDD